MIQPILIILLFTGAAFYLGRMAVLSFQAKKSCATGCGKCGTIDVEKIVTDLRKKEPLLER